MSSKSLKKYVKSRQYQERAQPTERKRLGFLEKKQDYKKRAVAQHKLENRRAKLQREAYLRNPDEFNTGMTHTQSVDGATVDTRTKQRSVKKVEREIKKDLRFLDVARHMELKKVEKLKKNLQMLEETAQVGAAGRKHVVFKESVEEAKNFSAADHLNTLPELAGSSLTSLRKDQLESRSVIVNRAGTVNIDKVRASRDKGYQELDDRLTRAVAIEGTIKKRKRKQEAMKASKAGKQAIRLVKKDEFGNVVDTIYKYKPVRRR